MIGSQSVLARFSSSDSDLTQWYSLVPRYWLVNYDLTRRIMSKTGVSLSSHSVFNIPRTVKFLMMEQTNALLNKSDAKLLSSIENILVVLAPGRCCNVLRSWTSSSVNIVNKWELWKLAGISLAMILTYEGITRNCNFGKLAEPLLSLLFCERSWNLFKERFVTFTLWSILR